MCNNGREHESAKRHGFRPPQHRFGIEHIDGRHSWHAASRARIRPSRATDLRAILSVHRAAFETDAEAALVETLLSSDAAEVSLVALADAMVVGHLLLNRIFILGDDGSQTPSLSLAPIAVRPQYQRRGIGTALVHDALGKARDAAWGSVIVLGHPEYYPRFGFEPAIPHGILPPWPDVPPEAWMVVELIPGALAHLSGTAIFPKVFDAAV